MKLKARGAVASALAASALLGACGGAARPATHTTARAPSAARSAARTSSLSFDGPQLTHPAAAPSLVGRDYRGGRVDLAADRGHAVLLTFIYTHCPDVCPLIVSTLHNALAQLGSRASEVRVIAVSTDPKGDTAKTVAAFLARREMVGRMQYVIGGRAELAPIWRTWGISVTNPTAHDKVNHSALVYGITASGKVTVVYPSNFTPRDIAHDVPLLAES